MSEQTILSWSGGKDSALTLQALRAGHLFEVVGLLTSVTAGYDRISIHGVRTTLLERQSESVALPLRLIDLQPQCSNDEYETAFHSALDLIRVEMPNVTRIAFGDLFLEDVRAYRERMLEGTGFEALFPLWGMNTSELATRFIDDGFEARLVCVDATQLDGAFAGRAFDDELLSELPPSVDPCGERGEFHTFVWNGPVFNFAIRHHVGVCVLREDRFVYCDLVEG